MLSNAVTKRMRPLLGTFVEIGIETLDDTQLMNIAFSHAFHAIEQVQQQMSFHSAASDLTRLNAAPGMWHLMPANLVSVLHKAKELAKDTDELFNCTVGGHLIAKGKLPNHFSHAPIPLGHADDIEIKHLDVRLKRPVIITLDGIAKGYAVDQGVNALLQCGIEKGWINAGGDMRVFGDLHLPVAQRSADGIQSLTTLHNQALATSEVSRANPYDYPGYIVKGNGEQPHDGTVSVMADETWLADAMTKVLIQLPPELRGQMAQQCNAHYIAP